MIKQYKASDILTMYESAQRSAVKYSDGIIGFVLNHNMSLMKDIYNETIAKRDEIIRKFSDKQDDAGRASISDPKKLEEANKEYADYLDMEYSLDIVSLPETKLTSSNMPFGDMKELSWMIVISSSDDIRKVLGLVDEEAEAARAKEEAEKAAAEEKARKESLKYDPKDPIDDDRFV